MVHDTTHFWDFVQAQLCQLFILKAQLLQHLNSASTSTVPFPEFPVCSPPDLSGGTKCQDCGTFIGRKGTSACEQVVHGWGSTHCLLLERTYPLQKETRSFFKMYIHQKTNVKIAKLFNTHNSQVRDPSKQQKIEQMWQSWWIHWFNMV